MATLLAFADAVDIGFGRGRLSVRAAASLRRVDSAFGRAADINEAWRSPEQADANYAAYQSYLRGGPWAPLAFAAKDSIHCRGEAVDTDDTSTEQMRVWNDHGWFWTVYRNGILIERWHLEYDEPRDNHRNDTAAGGATPFNPATILEVSMSNPIVNVVAKYGEPTGNGTLWIGKDDGGFERYEAPYDPNPRGVIGKVFYGGQAEPPSIDQRDFQTVQRLWKTMCKNDTLAK